MDTSDHHMLLSFQGPSSLILLKYCCKLTNPPCNERTWSQNNVTCINPPIKYKR